MVAERGLVRFMWVKDWGLPFENNSIILYCFTTTPFGILSSFFLLNMVLSNHLCDQNNEIFQVACKRFYVDNFVQSVNSLPQAILIYRSLTEKLASASFNLRHWTSNSSEFVDKVLPEKRLEKEGIISLLGIGWD